MESLNRKNWETHKVIYEPCILIPVDILAIWQYVASRIHTEFCIYHKAKWTEEGLQLENVYHIPKQECTTASVDILEAVPLEYNVVVHSHPGFHSHNFSHADRTATGNREAHILLNCEGEPQKAVLRLKLPNNMYIVIEAKIKLIPSSHVHVDISPIREKQFTYHHYPQYYQYRFYKNHKDDEDDIIIV